jgi:PQQ-like domain/Beta-propeller repeat
MNPMKRLCGRPILLVLLLAGALRPAYGQVTQEWAARYINPVSSNNAKAMALDSSGDVYVTGYSYRLGSTVDYATVKYAGQTGTQIWEARYNVSEYGQAVPFAIALDGAGDVYVTGYSGTSFATLYYTTIKYDGRTGAQRWVARYNAASGQDRASAITVDQVGNVYVTGISWGGASGFDYATLKYDGLTGAQLWVARYNGPGNYSDSANAIALDADGNVFVTGYSYGLGNGADYATVKYDGATGAQLWEARYSGPSDVNEGTAIAVDLEQNVLVTGYSRGLGTNEDYATLKYDGATGAQIWVSRYNGPANDRDVPHGLALDSNGNAYVTGESVGLGTDVDYATVKYDGSTGDELWVARYNGPANRRDMGRAIVVDSSGAAAYVTGFSSSTSTQADATTTLKYDGMTGEQLWIVSYSGPGNASEANAIALDAAENVYVTGGIASFVGADYLTVKYSQP